MIYDGVLQPAIVLKMTGGLLLISEAAILMCLKNNFFRKIIDKTLPLAWLMHDTITRHHKQTIFLWFRFSMIHYIKILCYASLRSSCSAVFKNIFWNFSQSILMELY